MAEGGWLRNCRQYFSKHELGTLAIKETVANKLLEKYNKYLVKSLCGDSVWEAENLKNTIIQGGSDSESSS